MGEIRVHRDEPPIPVRETHPEPLAVRAPDAAPPPPPEHVDVSEPGTEDGHQVGGAVGRGVVHDEHVGPRDVRPDALAELGEVLALVEGGDDDESVALAHGGPPSASPASVSTSSSAISQVPPQKRSSGFTRRTQRTVRVGNRAS